MFSGAARSPGSLDVDGLALSHPHFARFLEIGVEVGKGIDDDARRWIASGRPTTYHFLDVNLDDAADVDDDDWLAAVRSEIATIKPAWLCGDAGLWHFGVRERGHMLLLPPVLVDDAATAFAAGVERLRSLTGCEVVPENPPGTAFVGDLHLLEFFARVCERADCGMLLDVAHLAMFQHVTGRAPLQDVAFPWERVIEVHVAGTSERSVDGFSVVDDSHTCAVSEATWALFDHVVARANNLKAVVFECERNPNDDVVAGFERIAKTWAP
jgi:uncharacterized protein (UPF0276 family)